jgi:ligand-binding SRPBCC domain-containing protein
MHKFSTQQFLPISISEAWSFFSSPKNLSLITPPEMDFKIITPHLQDKIYEGMKVEYRVKPLLGISLRWETRIDHVFAPHYFTDIQMKGPYAFWQHRHHFVEKENGVIMLDEVIYKLPFGFIGNIVHHFIVRKKIEKIFEYRKNILNKLFSEHGKRVA